MCFEMINLVDSMEDPQFTEVLTIRRCERDHPESSYQHQAAVASRIFIQNKVVEGAIAEAAKYETVKIAVDEEVNECAERSVVIHAPMIGRNLNPEVFHPEICFRANSVQMLGKAIVLQLKDFGYVAQACLTFAEKDQLPEGVAAQATLKLKINVDSESGVVYQHDVI